MKRETLELLDLKLYVSSEDTLILANNIEAARHYGLGDEKTLKENEKIKTEYSPRNAVTINRDRLHIDFSDEEREAYTETGVANATLSILTFECSLGRDYKEIDIKCVDDRLF
jgi:hypothetical protein